MINKIRPIILSLALAILFCCFVAAQTNAIVLGSLKYSPDGRFLAGSGIGGFGIWDGQTLELLYMPPIDYLVTAIDWHSDNKYLASVSDDGYLRVWDILNQRIRVELDIAKSNPISLLSVAWDTNFRLYIGTGNTDTIFVYDLVTSQITTYSVTSTTSMDFNILTNILAIGDINGSVELFSTLDNDSASTIGLRDFGGVREVSWNNNNHLAVGYANGKVEIYELSSDVPILELTTSSFTPIQTLVWHEEGKILASVDSASNILLWDTTDGQILASYKGRSGIAFHPVKLNEFIYIDTDQDLSQFLKVDISEFINHE